MAERKDCVIDSQQKAWVKKVGLNAFNLYDVPVGINWYHIYHR